MSFVLIRSIVLILGCASLVFRLFRLNLTGTYPRFTAFLIFEALQTLIVVSADRASDIYAYIYFALAPLNWTFHGLVVLEVFRTSLQKHPGIATTSRRVIICCLAIAAGLALASIVIDIQRHDSPYTKLENFLTIERAMYSSLFLFVLLLMLALSWFPVPLARNSLIHAAVYTFYFALKTASLLMRNVFGPQFTPILNVILFTGTICCLLLWGLLLSRQGEDEEVRSSAFRRDPEEEERLIRQMETLNETLMTSGRK